LIAAHGADYPLPNLLSLVTAPGCSRVGSQWDRCGAYYVKPIEGEVGRWSAGPRTRSRCATGRGSSSRAGRI